MDESGRSPWYECPRCGLAADSLHVVRYYAEPVASGLEWGLDLICLACLFKWTVRYERKGDCMALDGGQFRVGDVVTLRHDVARHCPLRTDRFMAGTAGVIQGLVFTFFEWVTVVFPEMRDKTPVFMPSVYLEFVRSRYDGAGAGNDGGSPSSSQR